MTATMPTIIDSNRDLRLVAQISDTVLREQLCVVNRCAAIQNMGDKR